MARPSNTSERRVGIARALLKVMAKKGYEGASIADIAKVAKVAPGLVHYHFTNKLEILLVAIDELTHDYEARLERHMKLAEGNPERELRAFVEAHLHVGREADPEALACWIAIGGEALREARVKRAYARVLAGGVARLAAILERGVAQKRFTCAEPAAAAAAVIANIQGYFILAASAREAIPDGSAARTTLAMLQGLVTTLPPLRRTRRADAGAPRTRRNNQEGEIA